MIWKKEISGGFELERLSIIAFVLLIISFFESSYLFMFISSIIFVLCRLSVYYLNHVADALVLENEKETIRLSVGDESSLILKFSQLNRIPIYNAILRIKLEPIVEGVGIPTIILNENLYIQIPISIKGKGRIHIPLKLKGVTRGVTKIKSIEITIQNFFGVGSVYLTHYHFYQKELVIFPIPIQVPQTEKLIATKSHGHYTSPSSIYEQVLSPIGTRDYVYTDPFQRIHWKATAKTQSLKTKVFERTSDYSWTFIINLREPNTPNFHIGVVENIEEIASNVAFLAETASKKGIEYELFINLHTVTGPSIYHLPKGGGAHQLAKVLDILARINRYSYTQPINKLLYYVDKQQAKSPIVIFCGPIGDEGKRSFAQMQKNGQKVYFLHADNQFPAIVPY
ncbi:DUF58 domain-containing protein [Bacillus sp. RG28]|uniref:DUF58 domain-containing protein n=1 Tax=Gottfriedia endophytica TaxID=2820819 RepID=A0A940NRJ0_9BACI|nr:DUF58 domain-containing protein [Gottfriedia endophytica]MBP0726465.1 DUF58 domain-containing protein [Gottfriedia endophytica]